MMMISVGESGMKYSAMSKSTIPKVSKSQDWFSLKMGLRA
jgi:hypothetical protein